MRAAAVYVLNTGLLLILPAEQKGMAYCKSMRRRAVLAQRFSASPSAFLLCRPNAGPNVHTEARVLHKPSVQGLGRGSTIGHQPAHSIETGLRFNEEHACWRSFSRVALASLGSYDRCFYMFYTVAFCRIVSARRGATSCTTQYNSTSCENSNVWQTHETDTCTARNIPSSIPDADLIYYEYDTYRSFL